MNLCKRRFFSLILLVPGIIVTLLIVDILFQGSVFHPLLYVYNIWSWNLCKDKTYPSCNPKRHLVDRSKVFQKAVVVSEQNEATLAGLNILKQGGNAIDAAVAVGYALAVTYPCCGNIGGGGFMTIRFADGRKTFINFRERAPLAATSNMFLDETGDVVQDLSTKSFKSVAVPGTVKGLEYVLNKYGTLPRRKIIEPAIRLADGFPLHQGDVAILENSKEELRKIPLARDIFFKPNGDLLQAGDLLVQKRLKSTLLEIASQGDKAFYSGRIADQLVIASNENGGIITKEDLQKYEVIETLPLECSYRKYRIITAPAPGGGITLCQILNILEGYNIQKSDSISPKLIHRLVAAMALGFKDRNQLLGDPKFIDIPEEQLLSKSYSSLLRESIPDDVALDISDQSIDQPDPGSKNTTHYSVVDQFGNAVSVTYTINSLFGSFIAPKQLGFFLNNEMDDFSAKPGYPNKFGLVQYEANAIQAGKQPLSSMSPTIVEKNEKLFLITGSPGGPTIISTIVQTLVKYIDLGYSPNNAVSSPRIHYQGKPNFIFTEANSIKKDKFIALWEMGYRVIPFRPWGAAQTIYISRDNKIIGVNDYRRPAGSALGF